MKVYCDDLHSAVDVEPELFEPTGNRQYRCPECDLTFRAKLDRWELVVGPFEAAGLERVPLGALVKANARL